MSNRRDTNDYQRFRVYAWEDRHVHHKDTGTIPFEQAQSIVDYVWEQAGLAYPPKIRELGRNASTTAATANRLTIRVPAEGISTTILLHEIAHSMTTDAASERTHAHRPRFVGVFMKLLCDPIPTFNLDELTASAHREGVEFNFDGPLHV